MLMKHLPVFDLRLQNIADYKDVVHVILFNLSLLLLTLFRCLPPFYRFFPFITGNTLQCLRWYLVRKDPTQAAELSVNSLCHSRKCALHNG